MRNGVPLMNNALVYLMIQLLNSNCFVDECCQLSSQLVIPNIGLSLPARGIASPVLFNSLPLQVTIQVQFL